MPSISSDSDFRTTLETFGLNKEPDHYKDFMHVWYLDQDFKSETDPQNRIYRVFIGHFPRANSGIAFYYAGINREYSNETLWEIEWAIESSQ